MVGRLMARNLPLTDTLGAVHPTCGVEEHAVVVQRCGLVERVCRVYYE